MYHPRRIALVWSGVEQEQRGALSFYCSYEVSQVEVPMLSLRLTWFEILVPRA